MTAEQLEELGEQIAVFAARIDAAEHALLTRLRVFDSHEAWGPMGFISCAHWLSWRTGIGLVAAREKVRVARALGDLPKIDGLLRRGELSYSKVRAITRAATPALEQDFIDIAMSGTASHVERLARAYRKHGGGVGDARERRPDPLRFVRRSETADGMVRIEMQLEPEEAAIVWEAMMAAAFGPQLTTADSDASAEASPVADPVTAPQPGDASAEAPAEPAAPGSDSLEQYERQRADAIVDVARAYLEHRPRTLGSGYELVLISSKEQLEHGPGGVGGFLRDGTPIPLPVARMLASDAARVDVTLGDDGEILDVGRRTRTIPSAIARALWLRDGGCRVPGCSRKRHLHAHHIHPWAQGGPTRLSNLVLVCSGHHRMIHEDKLFTEIHDGKFVFLDQSRRAIPHTGPSATTGRELAELDDFLQDANLHIDPSTNYPKWDGTPMRLGESLDWMLMAHTPPVPADHAPS